MDYQTFLASKRRAVQPAGFDVELSAISDTLFPFQREIVRWCCRMGRAACFASTGLGKTRILTEYARLVHEHTGGNVLILAPLAVAQQTIAEAARIGVTVRYCRSQADVQTGITIINYDMVHAFVLSSFVGIVPDESSLLKSESGKTRALLIESCAGIPYRLCLTATPAPNDHTELGGHAEFLGICTLAEMLSMYFVHDGGDTSQWRLKGHARREFWRWVASWAVMLRTPGDIGHDDAGYLLPPLRTHEHRVGANQGWAQEQGYLFADTALSLNQQRKARKGSLPERVAACAELVNSTPGPWLIWCVLNAEGDALAKAIPDAVQVAGSDQREHKERAMLDFAAGKIRALVSKSSICGWGMNFQHCHQVAFVGVDYSYEGYFQAVRRCWRFGQHNPVDVHLFLSDSEAGVLGSLLAKQAAADEMAIEMIAHMAETMRANLRTARPMSRDEYNPQLPMVLPDWLEESA